MRLSRLVILLVAAAIVVFPAGVALAESWDPPANPVRALPDTVEKGGTFNVTVNFTAPADNFSTINLYDYAPDGWNATANPAWCQPPATNFEYNGNMTSYTWAREGGYPNGTNFTGRYKVTVPCDAELGIYTFFSYDTALGYYVGNTSHFYEPINITSDFNVTVIPPAICSTPSIDFYVLPGQNPQNETLELWSSTPCMINWSLSDDAAWLSESPTNGSCNYTEHSFVNLSVNTSNMSIGDYPANITITSNSTEANNSPRIVPVTLHITDKGILKGHVDFFRKQPAGDSTWETPLVVRFFDNATQNETTWSPINITTDAWGNFTIEDIVPGSYDIGIKNCTCLSALVTNVTINGGALTEVDFGATREGDVKESDKVDGSDFALFSGAYNARPGDGNWNANADLNRSGKVDGSDFALLSGNYNARGAAYGYF